MSPTQIADLSPDTDAAAHFHLSAVQAIATGQFPVFWADFWIRNGLAEMVGADRKWLEDNGRRLQEALCGDPPTMAERLRELQRRLRREIWFWPRRKAATFFAQWIAELRARRALEPDSTDLGHRSSLADVLIAICDPAETIRLVELLAEAPTRH